MPNSSTVEPALLNDATVTGPVRESERIASMDVLRGFALLGIMLINIPSMAMITAARFYPYPYADTSRLDVWIWYATNIFIDGRFMAIFSLLFGAGTFLFTSHLEMKGSSSGYAYSRRLLFLLVVGLLHAYLVWDGDVLVSYALCGATIFWFRKCSAKWLVIWSAVFFMIGAVFAAETFGIQSYIINLMPRQFSAAAEIAALRGGFFDQLPVRVSHSIYVQTVGFIASSYWRITTAMLIGMAFAKAKLFSQSARTTVVARIFLFTGFGIGIAIASAGLAFRFMLAYTPQEGMLASQIGNYLSSVPVALGWVGLVLLLISSSIGHKISEKVAPIGRMAFTNYLLESLIGTAIFYGTGLGMFGKVHRGVLVLIVVGIWYVQLVLSDWWMEHFQFGPLEWIWRGFVYRKLSPIRRRRIVAG